MPISSMFSALELAQLMQARRVPRASAVGFLVPVQWTLVHFLAFQPGLAFLLQELRNQDQVLLQLLVSALELELQPA